MTNPEIDVWGNKRWYDSNHRLHREEGPAEETYNYKSWGIHGKCHREDGPAVEHRDGRKEWWINGKKIK